MWVRIVGTAEKPTTDRGIHHEKLAIVALSLAAAPLAAQTGAVAGMGALYTVAKGYVIKAAEGMSEENYSLQADARGPELRPAGRTRRQRQLHDLRHGPGRKESQRHGLREDHGQGRAWCRRSRIRSRIATRPTPSATPPATANVRYFGMKTNKLGVLSFNSGHDMEHYGNMVTYFRLKGMVPPSSQRGM